jgi:hypothetical protein
VIDVMMCGGVQLFESLAKIFVARCFLGVSTPHGDALCADRDASKRSTNQCELFLLLLDL